MELVTYNEIVIDRPAAIIWPYIVNPEEWKQGAKLDLVSGEPESLAMDGMSHRRMQLNKVKSLELCRRNRRENN